MRAAHAAAARLRDHGIRTTVLAGGSTAESTELLRGALAAGVAAVLVAGGDGTVNLAVQEMVGRPEPLGIIPVGTGNDLATTLGLHDLDAVGAADAVAGGVTRTIDVARVIRADGTVQRFSTILASGFDSRVNDRANRMRWPRGRMRYNIALLTEFLTLRGIPYELEIDLADGTVTTVTGDFMMATVGNGRTYGGGIPICPDADTADGLLDLVLVRSPGRLRALLLLPRVYRGTHTTADVVSTYRVRAVRLSAPGITAYADGDPIGVLPLRVAVEPRALRVFVPA